MIILTLVISVGQQRRRRSDLKIYLTLVPQKNVCSFTGRAKEDERGTDPPRPWISLQWRFMRLELTVLYGIDIPPLCSDSRA